MQCTKQAFGNTDHSKPKDLGAGEGKEAAAMGMSKLPHAQPSWRPILQHSHLSSSFQKIIPILCILKEER